MEITKTELIQLNNFMVKQFKQYCKSEGIKPKSAKYLSYQKQYFGGAITAIDYLTGRFNNAASKGSNILPNQYISSIRGEAIEEI